MQNKRDLQYVNCDVRSNYEFVFIHHSFYVNIIKEKKKNLIRIEWIFIGELHIITKYTTRAIFSIDSARLIDWFYFITYFVWWHVLCFEIRIFSCKYRGNFYRWLVRAFSVRFTRLQSRITYPTFGIF